MLFEREHYLRELDHRFTQALAGSGQFVLVVGEAGIGKTSLLRAFADRVQSKVRVISASCEDLTTPEPLGLMHDLRLPIEGSSRIEQFACALDLLTSEPTLLVIEDIHWADDASIDFVRYLGRRLANKHLLILVSSRDDDDGSRARLRRVFTDIPSTLRSRLHLSPLTIQAVRDMVVQAGLFGIPVYDLTAGNPLLVTELIASGDPSSSNISDIVLGRADKLSTEARSVLDFCSIFPARVPDNVMEASNRIGTMLDECIESGLLISENDNYHFRHELTRRAVERALGPADVRRHNREAFAILEKSGASAARLLHHAAAASLIDEIIRLAPSAAKDAMASGAFRSAASALETMRPYADKLDLDAQAEFWRSHGDAHHLIEPTEALQSMLKATRLYEMGAERKTVDQRPILILAQFLAGDRITADRSIEAAVASLEKGGESIELVSVLIDQSQFASIDEDWTLARSIADRAMSMADRIGSKRYAVMARAVSQTLMVPADLAGRPTAFDALIREGREAGIPHDEVSRLYIYLANSEMLMLKFGDALATCERGAAYMMDHDVDVWLGWNRGCQAYVRFLMGDAEAARQLAEASLSERSIGPIGRCTANWALAGIDIRCGKNPLEAIQELENHLVRGRDGLRFVPYAILMAERAWTRGKDIEQALAILDDAIACYGDRQTPYRGGRLQYWRRKLDPTWKVASYVDQTLADSLLAAGDWEGAAAQWEALSLPFERALALLEGDETGVREALMELERMGATATTARALTDLARRGMTVRGPRASTRSNAFHLTRRELDVLKAIGEGLSNKQIANRLFVSPKTVDHHVSSILAKTDTRSRGQAAALVRNQNLF